MISSIAKSSLLSPHNIITMANLHAIATLCFLATLVALALAAPKKIIIEGRVYCDTCRAGFETSATEYIEGAKVKLECRNYTTGEIVHTGEGVSNNDGVYQITVHDDYQEETCAVRLVSSAREDCAEINDERNSAPVIVTNNVGIASNVRYTNSLGFLKDKPLPSCGQLLMQYALGVDD
ncbi:hypothetical protein Cni_G12940 [Canna indica]|uniref:Uncharacterized protein n=1 Tax=Canna indica TaxID=4628 RepID=A0AAQ3KAE9_9LILI|nr:hypothetical protein Cni_G12940 [Canna indica]